MSISVNGNSPQLTLYTWHPTPLVSNWAPGKSGFVIKHTVKGNYTETSKVVQRPRDETNGYTQSICKVWLAISYSWRCLKQATKTKQWCSGSLLSWILGWVTMLVQSGTSVCSLARNITRSAKDTCIEIPHHRLLVCYYDAYISLVH